MRNNNNINPNQGQSAAGEMKRRTRKRRWDAIVVGVGFSIAFALLIAKVAHVTPCEGISYLRIDAKACNLVSNSNTIVGQISNQHGLGFTIIIQYALLALEFSQGLVDHLQQFLQNIGLQ
jgi:hypothetical protein